MFKFLTRLIFLGILVAFCASRFDETIRRVIVWQVGEQTSMRAELGSAHVDFSGQKAQFVRFRLSDPKQGDKELVQVGSAAFHVTMDDLLYKRQRINEGIVHDIHMEIAGVGEGGALSPDALFAKFKKSLPDWMNDTTGDPDKTENTDATNTSLALLLGGANPDAAVAQLLTQFQSVEIANTLKERWPQEAALLQTKAASIDTRIKQLQMILNGVDQSQDKAAQVRLVLEQLASIEEEIRGVETLLREAQEKGGADFRTLQAAKKNDADRLKQLKAPRLDASVLSEKIVGETIREEYGKLLLWGDWARSLVEPPEKEREVDFLNRLGLDLPEKVRGKTFRFDRGEQEPPEIAVDKLYLDGTIFLGPTPVYFNGQIIDLAQPLDAGEHPLRAQFAFSGREPPSSPLLTDDVRATLLSPESQRALRPDTIPELFVTLTMDRTAGAELDRLVVQCPAYLLPEQRFGNPDELAIDVALGFATLDAVLEFRGEEIVGQVRLLQHNVALRPVLPSPLQQTSIAQILTTTLAGIQSLTTEIKLGGSRSAPEYVVTSNLGDQLAHNLDAALAQQWGDARTRLEQTLNKEIGDATSSINAVTQELGPALLKNLVDQQSGFDKNIASNATVSSLLQSQLSQLSEKDRAQVDRFLRTPAVQELFRAGGVGGTTHTATDAANPNPSNGAEQHGRTLEIAIPSLLDKLRQPK